MTDELLTNDNEHIVRMRERVKMLGVRAWGDPDESYPLPEKTALKGVMVGRMGLGKSLTLPPPFTVPTPAIGTDIAQSNTDAPLS